MKNRAPRSQPATADNTPLPDENVSLIRKKLSASLSSYLDQNPAMVPVSRSSNENRGFFRRFESIVVEAAREMPRDVLEGDKNAFGGICHVAEDIASKAYKKVIMVHYGQIFMLVLAFFACCTMSFCFSQANYVNRANECLLYAEWQISRIDGLSQTIDKFTLNRQTTKWGENKHCDWTTYGFVGCAILAFLTTWFFVLFRPYKEAFMSRRSTSATRLVLPTLVLTIALLIFTLIATITMMNGSAHWCNHLNAAFRNVGANALHCWNSDAVITKIFVEENSTNFEKINTDVTIKILNNATIVERDYFTYVILGQVFAWTSVVLWLINVFLILIRFIWHLDFPAYYFNFHGSSLSANVLKDDFDQTIDVTNDNNLMTPVSIGNQSFAEQVLSHAHLPKATIPYFGMKAPGDENCDTRILTAYDDDQQNSSSNSNIGDTIKENNEECEKQKSDLLLTQRDIEPIFTDRSTAPTFIEDTQSTNTVTERSNANSNDIITER